MLSAFPACAACSDTPPTAVPGDASTDGPLPPKRDGGVADADEDAVSEEGGGLAEPEIDQL